MPPSGRNAKPTAKTASALSVAATGSCDGKNLGPMKADEQAEDHPVVPFQGVSKSKAEQSPADFRR